MTNETSQALMLSAAIKHAKHEARTPTDRRAYVLFFLQCLARDYVKARRYTQANIVRSLITRASAARLMTSLLENLREEERAARGQDGDPLCNTGPTELRLSPDVNHGNVAPDRSHEALEAYIGGIHGY